MPEISTDDPDGLAGVLPRLPTEAVNYIDEIGRLMEKTQECARLARTADTPAEKVHNLELAKWGLRDLDRLTEGEPLVQLTGLGSSREELAGLENSYRLLGYYRAAGIA